MSLIDRYTQYGSPQIIVLFLLRMFIGWHFLYEGLVKLWNPGWSAVGYLNDSAGFMAPFFRWMASSSSVMSFVDLLNVWGLIIIGISLMVGLFSRLGALAGVVLLLFYYFSHPALIGVDYALPTEGSYLFINKNLIEAAALLVLFFFPTSHILGLDRFIYGAREKKGGEVISEKETTEQLTTY